MTQNIESTILIVDDNPTNLEVLSEALVISGFRVAVAVDGESAIKQAKYRPPTLILLDVMMPGINGFETCEQLKLDPITQDIPIIFMTALTDTENKVKGLSLGAVDYITKPFQQEEVIARVRTHIQLCNYAKTLQEQNKLLKKEIEQREKAEMALQSVNLELEQALRNIQSTQVQLVQTEKMSALGKLVAGVAHEINNPVSFIYGNLFHAEKYIKNLLELLELYGQFYPNPGQEIQKKAKAIELDFLIEDLPKMFSSMTMGAERICEIITSLKAFSRVDEAKIKLVDIHESIDSTLLMLQSRFQSTLKRPAIKMIKEYGNLPLVECYAGQLNQVFMNILINALDAIEERDSQLAIADPSFIRINTDVSDKNTVIIRISDNALGIPEELQKRLFDPFFTTKPIGKGTGLGLSISYQIVVEQHGGELKCISTPGKGTEFAIAIPISQSIQT